MQLREAFETALPVPAVVMAGDDPEGGTLLSAEAMKVVKGILNSDISPYGEMVLYPSILGFGQRCQ